MTRPNERVKALEDERTQLEQELARISSEQMNSRVHPTEPRAKADEIKKRILEITSEIASLKS